jgi:hypothetical protein
LKVIQAGKAAQQIAAGLKPKLGVSQMLLGDFIAKAANHYLPIEQIANEENAQSAETDEHGAGRGGAKDDRMSRDRGIHQERCPSCQNHVDGERQHRQLEFPAFDTLGIDLIEDAHSHSSQN